MATKNDVVQVFRLFQAEFPETMQDASGLKDRIELWSDTFKNCDSHVFRTASINAMTESRVAPKISQVMRHVVTLTTPVEKSGEQLWSELLTAARGIGARAEELGKETQCAIDDAQGSIVTEDKDEYAKAWQYAEINGWADYRAKLKQFEHDAFEVLPDVLKNYIVNSDGLSALGRKDEESLKYEKNAFIKRVDEIREMTKRNAERKLFGGAE